MGLYLLRVGADSTKAGGGFWSHIFPNKSYVFIPIPECETYLEAQKAITYQNYNWNNRSVIDYLPKRIRNAPNEYYIHDDPEFQTFTYGSPQLDPRGREKNYAKLSGTRKGDMLTFYAAFTQNCTNIEGYYLFAYFIVDRAVSLNELTSEDMNLVKENHHFIHRCKLSQNQVIVKGCPEQSRVLKRAVLLSSREYDRKGVNYYPCQSVRRMLGCYYKSMNRSSMRKIDLPEKDILQFKQYLDKNSV